ncbi:MAG TPA: glucose 1-dehydrogenase [Acidimicrobiia bacterium]|jgi:7-alpha-hydroxysteroid dehydrogenase
MILDRFAVTDRVALVTGAGKGIGAATAKAVAEAGADVVCAARTESDLERTVAAVEAAGRAGHAVPTDVNDRAQLEHLVAETLERFGRIDILVNNAGGWPPQPTFRTSERAMEQAFHFNVVAPFLLTRMLATKMVETAGGGAIVNISSRAGSMVQPCFTAYGTAKAALSFMTRNIAPELAPKVRVNAIDVGGVATDALASVLTDDSITQQMLTNTPMQRVGEPEDIAAAVLYLVSPASSWVTGKVFEIDGGCEHPAFTIPFEQL